jgi:hypothetical protein
MWKSYDRFYSQTLKAEAGLLFLSKNVHEVPFINKICITCLLKSPLTTKNILMGLSSLQLIIKKKARLVKAKKATVITKTRKGQPVGSKLLLGRGNVRPFLHFLTFTIMPQLDLVELHCCNERSVCFNLFITPPTIFGKLTLFFKYFQFLPALKIVLSLKRAPHKGKVLFWRLLKIPLKHP